jgi:hypothetical protein
LFCFGDILCAAIDVAGHIAEQERRPFPHKRHDNVLGPILPNGGLFIHTHQCKAYRAEAQEGALL